MRTNAATASRSRALEEAERRFVGQILADGGIDRWRDATDRQLQAALHGFTRRGRVSRRIAADLVVALVDEPTRDRCWQVVESQIDVDWPGFWTRLSGRALPPYTTEPQFLFAWSAWRLGDVRLARAAVDAVLAQDPEHRAAAMLLALLWLDVPPDRLPPLGFRAAASTGAS